jgi:hypothetical protein
MSSVKRRKIDENVPSGLLGKKKHMVKEPAPASPSTSSESEQLATPTEPTEEVEAEVTKTFKDLVCVLFKLYVNCLLINIRESLTHCVMHVKL